LGGYLDWVPVTDHGVLLGGRYRVRKPLGLGGMAQVLLCEDERLGRLVAVKRLHADSAEDVERRFAREARLGAALNHPNLVSVFDTAVDDEGVLIVMEYVEGEALSRALRRGPLEPPRVARMARDLGGALDHAHGHDVVHRDVKPGNVLLREDGITKLADLGIATAVDLTRITRSGELLGTAAYMAPEQLEGREAGPASDVYALAAVCFEALTGRRPRRGRSAIELAHRIATEPPPDLREHLPDAPAAAAEALKRGMASDPEERTPSAGALADELWTALEGRGESPAEETRVLPAEAAAAPVRTARRSRPAPPSRAPVFERPAAPVPPTRRSRRSTAALIPVLLLAAVAAAATAVLLSSGDDGGGGAQDRQAGESPPRRAQPNDSTGNAGDAKSKPGESKSKPKKTKEPKQTSEPAPVATPAPSQATTVDPARGAQLNDQGYALMRRGDYAGAVPILQQAVASWPEDSIDINYAYALFNLGKSLNRAGRPAEAIPYLEQRLRWADQRATVQAELVLARQNAGQG
jgi:eukaryotic-like serine/threonine-protein kinase